MKDPFFSLVSPYFIQMHFICITHQYRWWWYCQLCFFCIKQSHNSHIYSTLHTALTTQYTWLDSQNDNLTFFSYDMAFIFHIASSSFISCTIFLLASGNIKTTKKLYQKNKYMFILQPYTQENTHNRNNHNKNKNIFICIFFSFQKSKPPKKCFHWLDSTIILLK